MSKNWPPGADHTTQNFERFFTGSKQTPNVGLFHTTESLGFPGYGGDGRSAPNSTVRINIAARTATVRGHFPADRSARALENRAGGVQTNTLNVYQWEVVGTCDSAKRHTWKVGGKTYVAGVDYIYWPEAPDWALQLLADVTVKWLAEEWDEFPLADGTPRGWVAYPDSYGIDARQRMTFAEWNAGRGIVGHQHVPENAHGDPGDLDVARIIQLAQGVVAPEEPDPVDHGPTVPDVSYLDPNSYPRAEVAEGPQIVWLRGRLRDHLAALDLPNAWGDIDPDGDVWDENDHENVATFQRAQGWSGADADGYLGPITLERLAAPVADVPAPEQPEKPADPETPPTEPQEPTGKRLADYPLSAFADDAYGPQITLLGQACVAYLTARGLTVPYAEGPGPRATGVDRKSVQLVQIDQGWWRGADGLPDPAQLRKGGGADGRVGPKTLEVLDQALAGLTPTVELVEVESLSWNVAGYNADDAPGVTGYRDHIPAIARKVLASGPHLIDFQELSADDPDMRPLMDRELDPTYIRVNGGSDGRYNYRDVSRTEYGRAAGVFKVAKANEYKGDDKQASYVAAVVDGAVAFDVSVHTENQGDSQVKVRQALDFLDQAIAKADERGIPIRNLLLVGDWNDEKEVVAAFAARGFEDIGDDDPTFNAWKGAPYKRLDHAFVLAGVKATGSTGDADGNSDHEPIHVTRHIIKKES